MAKVTPFFRGLIFILVAWTGASPLKWTDSTDDDTILYACAEQDFLLPWTFSETAGDEISSIEWFFHGRSEELIATFAHGAFVPTAPFFHRVRFSPKAGIILLGVLPGDKGNYSVEVSGHDSMNAFFRKRRMVIVDVAELPSTDAEDLEVQQDTKAVYNNGTGQWSLRLTCGHFTYLGHPPVHVVWTTPEGSTVNSSSLDKGNFQLLLPDPVKGGDYECSLTPQFLATSCLSETSSLRQSSSVHVNELAARLLLVQAEKAHLQTQNEQLIAKDSNLTQHLHHLQEQISSLNQILHQQQLLSGACAADQYTVVDDYTRDVMFPNRDHHCDREHDVISYSHWYRFLINGSDAVMPISCVQEQHCNTDAPMWLDLQGKELPAPGFEVTARACPSLSFEHDCCHVNWVVPVTVRNCGQFLLYKLRPPPVCHLRFCVQRS